VIESSFTKASAEYLAYLPAYWQLELFRNKRLSPVDVLDAQISRVNMGSHLLNPVTYQHFEVALSAARESEARYFRGNPRALEGITVAVKEEYAKRRESSVEEESTRRVVD
jgi:amidase